MYIVNLFNDNKKIQIHGEKRKLKTGNVVKGINAIDSFSFSILPSNVGFHAIRNYQTLVEVYNTNKRRYEFHGRVLWPTASMDEIGRISKSVTCESYLGFLCDSQQSYVEDRNWQVRELIEHIVNVHNSQVEAYKHFTVGEITVTDPNDNLYLGIQRENSWKTIQDKLIGKLGGKIRYRVVGGVTYLDYLKEIGETRVTPIKLSHNMKAITQESDPSAYITRLIPYGAKLEDSEERVEIAEVNNGVGYIDDADAIKEYGIHVGKVEFDEVTDANNLLRKAKEWLAENNRVCVKYSVTALELSLLGLDIDDFDVGNRHPIKNDLLGIDDTARIIKKNINICDEVQSTIEVGDGFKTLLDIEIDNAKKVEQSIVNLENTIVKAKKDNEQTIEDATTEIYKTIIEQNTAITKECEGIILEALKSYTETTNYEEFKETVQTQLGILADEIIMNFSTATEQIDNVDGDLQSKFTQLYKHISFSENGIKIGSSESNITLEMDNDIISFKKNGIQFGWWDGTDFHTGNIVVDVNERAQFGNFAFVPRSDGSLMFLKVR